MALKFGRKYLMKVPHRHNIDQIVDIRTAEVVFLPPHRKYLSDTFYLHGSVPIAQSRAFPESRERHLECITWADMSEF